MCARAQQPTPFENLKSAMQGRLKPLKEIEKGGHVVDCSASPPTEIRALALRGSALTQYIYNSVYRWNVAPVAGGMCVILQIPDLRGLNREDAIVLLSAHKTQFAAPSRTASSVLSVPDTRRVLPDDKFYIQTGATPEKEKQ